MAATQDDVRSTSATNLASSSKPLNLLEVQGFFLFLPKSHDLILHIKILIRDEVIIMKKIEMPKRESKNFLEVFEMFVISQAAKGVADITIRNYRYHMKKMSNYFDAEKPFDEVTKRDIEAMVVAMRKAGLAHNTIATYNWMLKTLPM